MTERPSQLPPRVNVPKSAPKPGSKRAEVSDIQSLGKYQVVRKIGAGGMGAVFLAVDPTLNRTVALKVLPKDRAENPVLVKRFQAEAQAAAHLRHENIISVYETGEADGLLYIALEFVEGIDVHNFMQKRGVVPVKRSLDIIKQVTRALEHAHEKGIVHRDIKPANLMIKRDGSVKLADMGLARSIDDTLDTSITRAGTTVGTVDYMAPEQARDSKAADVRSDIYSLGCTWYHMLTGRPPYPEGSLTNKLQAHATAPLPNPRDFNDQVPEGLTAVLHRMMAKKPDDRYSTPKELLEDLERVPTTTTNMLNEDVWESLVQEDIAARTAETGSDHPSMSSHTPSHSNGSSSHDVVATPEEPSRKHFGKVPEKKKKQGGSSQQREKSDRRGGSSSASEEPSRKHFKPSPVEEKSVKKKPGNKSAAGKAAQAEELKKRRKALPPKEARTDPPAKGSDGKTIDPDLLKYGGIGLGVLLLIGAFVWALVTWGMGDGKGGLAGGANPYVVEGEGGKPEVAPESEGADDSDGRRPPSDTGNNHRPPDQPTVVSVEGDNPATGNVRQAPVLAPEEQAEVDKLPTFPGTTGYSKVGGDAIFGGLLPTWAQQARIVTLEERRLKQLVVESPSDNKEALPDLQRAIDNLPGAGGTIEIRGDGPWLLQPTSLNNFRHVTIRASGRSRPVILLADEPTPSSAMLSKKGGTLELEGLHLLLADRANVDSEQCSIIRLEDGNLHMRNCTISVPQQPDAPQATVAISLPPATSSRRLSTEITTGRVLLENVAFVGPRLTAMRLRAAHFDVVVGNGLFAGGALPLFDVGGKTTFETTDRDEPSRSIRLLASTAIGHGSLLNFTHEGSDPPAVCRVLTRETLLAKSSGNPSGDAHPLIAIDAWPTEAADSAGLPSAQNLQWVAEKSILLADRPVFTRLRGDGATKPIDVAGASDWQQVWSNRIDSRSLMVEPVEAAVGLSTDEFPVRKMQAGLAQLIADASSREKPGVDAGQLTFPPEGWATHLHQRAEVRRKLASALQAEKNNAQQKWNVVEYDLNRRRQLDRFLSSSACPDGSHVRVVGSGRHQLDPLEIRDKSLRVEFVHQGDEPIVLQWAGAARGAKVDTSAAITLVNGRLELIAAHLRIPASTTRSTPGWLIIAENSSLRFDQCRLEGPTLGDKNHRGLVQWSAGATCEISDSFLVSGGTLLDVHGNEGSVLLNNVVGISLSTSLQWTLTAGEGEPLLAIRRSSLAASKQVCQVNAVKDSPRLQVRLERAVVGPPLERASAPTILSVQSSSLTKDTTSDQWPVEWWSLWSATSDAVTISPEINGAAVAVWKPDRSWGAGHVIANSSETTAVLLATAYDRADKLTPESLRLDAGADAQSLGPAGSPVGAEVTQVATKTRQPTQAKEKKDPETPKRRVPPPNF